MGGNIILHRYHSQMNTTNVLCMVSDCDELVGIDQGTKYKTLSKANVGY